LEVSDSKQNSNALNYIIEVVLDIQEYSSSVKRVTGTAVSISQASQANETTG
jgi:hypothetical protein